MCSQNVSQSASSGTIRSPVNSNGSFFDEGCCTWNDTVGPNPKGESAAIKNTLQYRTSRTDGCNACHSERYDSIRLLSCHISACVSRSGNECNTLISECRQTSPTTPCHNFFHIPSGDPFPL